MGDLKTLARARMELEEMYSGIPDDSVNLTFEDLAVHVKKNTSTTTTNMVSIKEAKSPKQTPPHTMIKLPSLDFSRGLMASKVHQTHLDHVGEGHPFDSQISRNPSHQHHNGVSRKSASEFRPAMEIRSMAYDQMSVMSMNSAYQERGGRSRRPGIPHSNICTVCSTYIYIFRHRCLVCGRVYCRSCTGIGMGEMTEGRKCIECLGRRFSQRYIQRAGMVGCCSGYPSSVKQAELKWAEKGPRRSGERAYGHSSMPSRARSPMGTPRTPVTPRSPKGAPAGFQDLPSFVASSPYSPYTPSFVASSPYSPYTHTHHHLPL